MKAQLSTAIVFSALLSAPFAAEAQYGAPITQSAIEPNIRFDQLPAPVQQTIRTEAGGRDIAAISRESWNGQPGFRVQFKERGRNPDLHVAVDGTLTRPLEKPPGIKSLFLGTRLENTPVAVQDTIRREVGAGEVLEVNREGSRGERHFRITVRHPEGAVYEIDVREDGKIQRDSRSGRKG